MVSRDEFTRKLQLRAGLILAIGLGFSTAAMARSPVTAPDCPSGQYGVKAHFREAYVKQDGTRVSAARVVAHCRNRLPGHEFWQPRLRDDRPANWAESGERAKAWAESEKERVLQALGRLPRLLDLPYVEGIHRMARSVDHPNPASSRNRTIVLYDEAFRSPDLERSLVHELSHQLYRQYSDEQRRAYQFSAGWYSADGKTRFSRRSCCFVERDGQISPEEDFANNLEYFVFEPSKLRQVTGNAWSWFSDLYGGKLKIGGPNR